MPIEFGLWRVDGGTREITSSGIDSEQRLEDILESDIELLGLDLLLIGRQVTTAYGKVVDLLGLNDAGELYVIELKRDKTPREIVAQLLDYGSWAQDLSFESLVGIFEASHPGEELNKGFFEQFGVNLPEALNETHHLVMVASQLDSSTERVVAYLSENFGVPINAVFFRYFEDDGRQYLARSWLIDRTEAEANINRVSRKKEPWNGQDFYISFGVDQSRSWADAVEYGFISAGGGKWYTQTLKALAPGNRVFVHIPKVGYVGVGKVLEPSVPVRDFQISADGTKVSIADAHLSQPGFLHDFENPALSEHVVRVEWIRTHEPEEAYWEPGLFANQNTAVKLRNQFTIARLVKWFELSEEE